MKYLVTVSEVGPHCEHIFEEVARDGRGMVETILTTDGSRWVFTASELRELADTDMFYVVLASREKRDPSTICIPTKICFEDRAIRVMRLFDESTDALPPRILAMVRNHQVLRDARHLIEHRGPRKGVRDAAPAADVKKVRHHIEVIDDKSGEYELLEVTVDKPTRIIYDGLQYVAKTAPPYRYTERDAIGEMQRQARVNNENRLDTEAELRVANNTITALRERIRKLERR